MKPDKLEERVRELLVDFTYDTDSEAGSVLLPDRIKNYTDKIIDVVSEERQKAVSEAWEESWRGSFAVYPCSGGENCENYKALTKLNQRLARLLHTQLVTKKK